jgi:dipeptidyl aminopeptidase/acylaminoacyl peptidase
MGRYTPRMQKLSMIAGLLLWAGVQGAQAPPPPEVYLAGFSVSGGKVTLTEPVNISNNPAYDNQPTFTPDGGAILFTSVRGDRKPDPKVAAATGSDIYRFDIASGKLSQLTTTNESEYSPTVTPDGRSFSVIQVEADGTQRLWRFPMAGGAKAELVLTDIKPVGYHAWADASTLALFVLGEPATLQLADTRTGKGEILARNIGRSLQRIPDGGISFVQRETSDSGQTVTVMRLDPATKKITPLVRVIEGVRDPDLAWTPDGLLLLAAGGKLHGWRQGETQFQPVADLEGAGLRGATRMAVSPKGDRLAIVASPQ